MYETSASVIALVAVPYVRRAEPRTAARVATVWVVLRFFLVNPGLFFGLSRVLLALGRGDVRQDALCLPDFPAPVFVPAFLFGRRMTQPSPQGRPVPR